MKRKLDPQDLVSRSQFVARALYTNLRRALYSATLVAQTWLGRGRKGCIGGSWKLDTRR